MFRSEWDVRKTGTPVPDQGPGWVGRGQGPVGPTSRSTDCLDLEATGTGGEILLYLFGVFELTLLVEAEMRT